MNEQISFGAWLQRRRKQLGHTQQTLADQVSCSFETIRRIEDGSRKASEQLAEMLAEALQVQPDERASFVRWARTEPAGKPIRPANLPHQVTSFIGRDKELAFASSLLRTDTVSLVTLVGAGGSGKTRLAVQIAWELFDTFPDGVFFVNLAPVGNRNLVASTIAQALGVRERAGQPVDESLKSYLREKQMLLLLDNYEQVVESAPLVADLLAAAHRLKVLVTSREGLRLQGEHVFTVPPLSLPDTAHLPDVQRLSEYEAVRLFVDRATAHRPDFQLTDQNAHAVAEVCARLDGLPLAIELAAARIQVLSPATMLGLLKNRLKLLTAGPRDLPARQQTLRNTIEWSYGLLDETEKKLFRRLAIFRGGHSLQAVEEVCGIEGDPGISVLDGIWSLVSKSLLEEREGSAGELRFWMLETIDEYAREKLQESDERRILVRAHAIYYMELAEEAAPYMTRTGQSEWFGVLEAEHDNIRAALQWARDEGSTNPDALEIGLRTAGAIYRFWLTRGHFSEGREHLEALLSSLPARPSLPPLSGDSSLGASQASRIKALNAIGTLAYRQGDYSAALTVLRQALDSGKELGDKQSMAISISSLGLIAYTQGNYAEARSLHEQSLVLCKEIGDKPSTATSLNNLGLVAYVEGDYSAARTLYEQSLALQRELGETRGTAVTLSNLALVAQMQEDYATARSLHEQSLALRIELGDKSGTALTLNNLGLVAYLQGDYPIARSLNKQCLKLFREIGEKRGIAANLAGLGGIASAMGIGLEAAEEGERGRGAEQAQRAARLLGAADEILTAIGAVLEPEDLIPYEQGANTARALLGEEKFQRAQQEGRAMSMEQAIVYALEDNGPTQVE